MTEDQFEKIINSAADHYNVPPVNPPFDQMWTAIETEAFGRSIVAAPKPQRFSLVNNPWLRMAAVLVLGVAIGRLSFAAKGTSANPEDPAAATVAAAEPAEDTYQLTTERYLGQTVTLLVSLPNQLRGDRVDTAFVRKASESLATLRLLMDSPAASNPRMRALFEDLELVLVQVVQMPETGSASDAKLIRQAMQQRDVMPRLFDAVAETPNF
jgi:hypothetical protein